MDKETQLSLDDDLDTAITEAEAEYTSRYKIELKPEIVI